MPLHENPLSIGELPGTGAKFLVGRGPHLGQTVTLAGWAEEKHGDAWRGELREPAVRDYVNRRKANGLPEDDDVVATEEGFLLHTCELGGMVEPAPEAAQAAEAARAARRPAEKNHRA